MRVYDLIPGKWYYCPSHHNGCKYFIFLEYEYYSTPSYYLIQGINGIKYNGYQINEDCFRELTPEEKLELL